MKKNYFWGIIELFESILNTKAQAYIYVARAFVFMLPAVTGVVVGLLLMTGFSQGVDFSDPKTLPWLLGVGLAIMINIAIVRYLLRADPEEMIFNLRVGFHRVTWIACFIFGFSLFPLLFAWGYYTKHMIN